MPNRCARRFSLYIHSQCCGARPFCQSRSWLKSSGSGSGLLLFDLGVLWRQSCDNSYHFSQFSKFFLHKLKEKIGTLLKKLNYFTLFFKTGARSRMIQNRSPVKIGSAPQHCIYVIDIKKTGVKTRSRLKSTH